MHVAWKLSSLLEWVNFKEEEKEGKDSLGSSLLQQIAQGASSYFLQVWADWRVMCVPWLCPYILLVPLSFANPTSGKPPQHHKELPPPPASLCSILVESQEVDSTEVVRAKGDWMERCPSDAITRRRLSTGQEQCSWSGRSSCNWWRDEWKVRNWRQQVWDSQLRKKRHGGRLWNF